MSSTSAESRPDGAWPSLATVVPVYNEESGIERSSHAIVSRRRTVSRKSPS